MSAPPASSKGEPRHSRIEDYALIGDTQTAALVGKDGSIDWVCFPRFDSDACFAALVGDRKNGRWLLSPRSEVKAVRRRYLPDTLVLETEMDTALGTIRIIDFMPPRNRAPDLVRIVEGVRGRVTVGHRHPPPGGAFRHPPQRVGVAAGAEHPRVRRGELDQARRGHGRCEGRAATSLTPR